MTAKLALALVAALSLSSANAAQTRNGTRHYAIDEAALKASGFKFAPIARENGLALLQLSAPEFKQIKDHLHNKTHGCGGIADLAPYLENSKDVVATFRAHANQPANKVGFDKVEPTFPEQTRQLLSYLSADRYRAYLTRLATFADREATTQNGVDAAAYLVATAQALGTQYGKALEVISVPTGRYNQPSTIVKVVGTRPELPGIVIGGHMDTTVQSFGGRNNPGADDDGSGSATVLEVLHAFLASPLRLERTAHFMFYAAEEKGLVGSGVVAKKFKDAGTQLRAVMQLDMTGYHPAENTKMYFMQDYVDLALATFLEKLALTYVGLTPDQLGRDRCGYACSDHASWTQNGYSAAIPFETAMRTYNPKIHSKDDALGMLDWAHAEKFVKLAGAFLVETGDPAPATAR